MGVRRLSISVPADVEIDIRTAAADAGMPVSAWLAKVAARAARLQDGRRAVREFEAEHGALTEQEKAAARRIVEDMGVAPVAEHVAG
jgi:hypothetical protein